MSKILEYENFCKKIVKKHADYERDRYEDRNVLEEIIFPYILANLEPQKILDIGREDYQAFYNEFFAGRELWTIDIDPERVEYGAKNHVVDGAENLDKHFKQADYFDFVLMNGVFGWGLNKPEDIEKAIQTIYDILRPGGIFIMGWNDIKDLTPMPLSEIQALKKFTPYNFEPLGTAKFKCINGEHTYNFFKK